MAGVASTSQGPPDGRTNENCPTCRRPHVSRDQQFDEALEADGTAVELRLAHGEILIRGTPFSVSDILASDRDAYYQAVDEWRSDCREDLRQTIIDRFPYPIAHPFFLSDRGYDNENSRLQHLKDTWEATISVVFAMLLGEARARELEEIGAPGIKREYLRSQTVRERVAVIEALRRYAFDLLPIAGIVQPRAVQCMLALNNLRNDVQHLAALNEAQSSAIADQAEPLLMDLLESLEALQRVRLLRLDRPQAGGKWRAECFAGYSPVHGYQTFRLSEDQRKAVAARENAAAEVWALHGDLAYSLSPYLVFRPRPTGRKTDLAYFKKSTGEGPDRRFTYEVIGESEEFEVSDAHLLADLDDIRRRFVSAGAPQR